MKLRPHRAREQGWEAIATMTVRRADTDTFVIGVEKRAHRTAWDRQDR